MKGSGQMPNLLSSDPCEMNSVQFAICTPFPPWRSLRFLDSLGGGVVRGSKVRKRGRKRKTKQLSYTEWCQYSCIRKELGAFLGGRKSSPITSQKCRQGLSPSFSSWCGTRHTAGASKGRPERMKQEEVFSPAPPRCDATDALRRHSPV